LQVQLAELLDTPGAQGRQRQSHHAPVVRIPPPNQEAGVRGSINETYGGVVAAQEPLGHISGGRASRIVVTTDGEEKLMLSRGESRQLGLLLAPANETAQASAELN
jgi:hypothetical protein